MTDKQSDDGLPALPAPDHWSQVLDEREKPYFAEYQMHEYARTAVAAALAARQPEPVGEAVAWLEDVSLELRAIINGRPVDAADKAKRALVWIENASLPAPQAAQAEQAEAPSEPMRAHVEKFAAGSGWVKDDGEGAFEFVQRKCYHQGWQDGRREALGDVHRDTPEVHFPEASPEQAEAPSEVQRARIVAAEAQKHLAGDRTHLRSLIYVNDLVWALQVLATQPTASNAGERPLLDTEGIERLETELFFRRRRLRETHTHPENVEDPGFFDGFHAAEAYYGITTKEQS